MSWIQFIVITSSQHVELFSHILTQCGALSVTYTDAADEPLFEPPPGETPLWSKTKLIALFDKKYPIDSIITSVKTECDESISFQWRSETLADQEWETTWKDHFKAMRFGRRLWVCPTDVFPENADAIRIELNPGLAFGTGTHPTTSLCLETLDGEGLDNLDVLDYGCGSGILSIACAKLGAHSVKAVDIDPQAILATKENAKINCVDEIVHNIAISDLEPACVDILVANILFNPLQKLSYVFASYIKPGGRIVLSGILQHQAAELKNTYSPWIKWRDTLLRDEWVCMVGDRI